MFLFARRGALLLALVFVLCSLPAEARWFIPSYRVAHPGGSVWEIMANVTEARRKGLYVVMRAHEGWASADTMWLAVGRVYLDPDAVLLFHEAEDCPAGVRYGDRQCSRAELATQATINFQPKCVRDLALSRRAYSGWSLVAITGAEILSACRGVAGIEPIARLPPNVKER